MNLSGWLKGNKRGKAQHLALPLELEDGRSSRLHRSILRGGAVTVIAIAVWATMTPVRELAIAPGQIMPEGDVRSVQHLEGGVVSKIVAKAGDRVEAGAPLVLISDDQTGRDLAQLKIRAENLRLQREQISALLAAKILELRPSLEDGGQLVAVQQTVFDSRLQSRIDERETLKARIGQRNAEITGLESELPGYDRIVDIREERARTLQSLLDRGLSTKREYLQEKANLEQAISQKTNAISRLGTLRTQLTEAESQLQSAEAEARRLWAEELAKVSADLGETTEAIAKAEGRMARLTVRSPTAGIVQIVVPRSPGEVVKPGDVVARIVPVETKLLAEVEIRADDIGHIKVGDHADLKVSTFDPSVYGKLRGEVTSISASTFQRQNGDFFFKATIGLDSQTLSGTVPVSPGMVVSAEIITGAKSFARYLLKPVFKTFGPAFSEK